MDADTFILAFIPVQTFAKRALMVDMLFIESYRLTVFRPRGILMASLGTFFVMPQKACVPVLLELRLSDLMVNGRLVNNK
ncbi:hypothetical protein HED50_19445 [Ochrobactrum oryzae]|uniref:hypothetical protein n=1 Tax=Brucella oryzae TaxID=335286 RepID=UPI00142D2EFE|nr:hypothetical protein [Brucella oryzae]NKC23137.1 hypothetical protein [Brucella oryzae]